MMLGEIDNLTVSFTINDDHSVLLVDVVEDGSNRKGIRQSIRNPLANEER
jgi:hypothetical protein